MAGILGLALLAWAISATIFLLRNQSRPALFHDELLVEIGSLDPKDKVEAWLHLRELAGKELPWHVRSFSTLGVLALIGLATATVAQTITLRISQNEKEMAEARVDAIERMSAATNEAGKRAVRAILDLSRSSNLRIGDYEDILKLRLDALQIGLDGELGRPEDEERFLIYLALNKLECAAEVYQASKIDSASILDADALSFAEFFFLIGAVKDSKAMLVKARGALMRSPRLGVRYLAMTKALQLQDETQVFLPGIGSAYSVSPEAAIKLVDEMHASLLKAKGRMLFDATSSKCSA